LTQSAFALQEREVFDVQAFTSQSLLALQTRPTLPAVQVLAPEIVQSATCVATLHDLEESLEQWAGAIAMSQLGMVGPKEARQLTAVFCWQ
jgi:hypothetical protein